MQASLKNDAMSTVVHPQWLTLAEVTSRQNKITTEMTMKIGLYRSSLLVCIVTLVLFCKAISHTFPTSPTAPTTDNATVEDDDDDDSETSTTKLVKEKLEFTYGDDDIFGPLHWRNKGPNDPLAPHHLRMKSLQRSFSMSKANNSLNFTNTGPPETNPPQKVKNLYAGSHCQTNWLSPININTKRVHIPELAKLKRSETEQLMRADTSNLPETLILIIATTNIHKADWVLGHPSKYYGIEIRTNALGLIQVMDNFHPHGTTNSFTTYDFHFLSIFYCNIRKALPHRTMHQINGKRFPLELEFVFLRKAVSKENVAVFSNLVESESNSEEDEENGIDAETLNTEPVPNMLYDGEYEAVIVSVLGEIDEEDRDNRYFQPVVDAAKKFVGRDSEIEESSYERNEVIVESWSPTWLLPDSSDYYYYDKGSFPVPPCWSVARFYVLRERIKISQAQLDALTHIRTDREKQSKNLLMCSHSVSLVNKHTLVSGESPVYLNLIEYDMRGKPDHKPRTQSEQQETDRRKQKREVFRKRLFGGSINLAEAENVATADRNRANGVNELIARIRNVQITFFTFLVSYFEFLS